MITEQEIRSLIDSFFSKYSGLEMKEIDRNRRLTRHIHSGLGLWLREDKRMIGRLIGYIACNSKLEIKLYNQDGNLYLDVRKGERISTIALDSYDTLEEAVSDIEYLLRRNGHCGKFSLNVTEYERSMIAEYRAAQPKIQQAIRVLLERE